MSFLTISGATDNQTVLVIVGVCAFLLVIFMFMAIWASRYTKVGPDQVLVVSGRRHTCIDSDGKTHVTGFRMVKGGGTFVFPIYERVDVLSLKPVSIDLVLPKVPARDGGSVELAGKVQVKIKSDDLFLARAAECLLGKSPDEVKDVAEQILESAARSTIGRQTAEQVMQAQSTLAAQLQEAAKPALADLGLEILSFSVRDLRIAEEKVRS